MSKKHELKTLPVYFGEVWTEKKKFELRKDDRDFEAGDRVLLREHDGEKYTGREVMAEILYILRDAREYGLSDGFCILSLGKVIRGLRRESI